MPGCRYLIGSQIFRGRMFLKIGWLVVCLGLTTVGLFQSISGRLPERRRKKRGLIREKKNVQTTPPVPTASAVGRCPTIIQISRIPRLWKFTQHHFTTDHSHSLKKNDRGSDYFMQATLLSYTSFLYKMPKKKKKKKKKRKETVYFMTWSQRCTRTDLIG